jgi:SAM-dependent methyltransferase
MSDAALWDRDYRAGRWDYLLAPREQGRLAVTACYAHLFGPGALLDVGCGAAGLYRHLDPRQVTHYCGVDLSTVALEQARQDIIPPADAAPIPAELVEASVEAFAPPDGRRYGAIVLAEVLYFVPDPLGEIARYAGFLAPGGCLIASMTHGRARHPAPDPKTEALWQSLAAGPFDTLDETLLQHPPSGNAWRIRAMRPRGN